jgi:hypothetical protein
VKYEVIKDSCMTSGLENVFSLTGSGPWIIIWQPQNVSPVQTVDIYQNSSKGKKLLEEETIYQ